MSSIEFLTAIKIMLRFSFSASFFLPFLCVDNYLCYGVVYVRVNSRKVNILKVCIVNCRSGSSMADNCKPSCEFTTNAGFPSHSVDIELSKVHSFDKQAELFNVLHSEDPSHYERLWLVGFLKYAGYTIEEICAIIDKEACWGDYDATMTYNQVSSVFRLSGRSGSGGKNISSPSGTWLKRSEWDKRFNKALCTLHYVGCVECPDRLDSGCGCNLL
jgi:hypothetical protein